MIWLQSSGPVTVSEHCSNSPMTNGNSWPRSTDCDGILRQTSARLCLSAQMQVRTLIRIQMPRDRMRQILLQTQTTTISKRICLPAAGGEPSTWLVLACVNYPDENRFCWCLTE